MSGDHGPVDDPVAGSADRPLDGADRLSRGTGVVSWPASWVAGRTALDRRRLGSLVVATVGVALSAGPFYHLVTHVVTLQAILGDAVPLLFGGVLFGVGVWLRWGASTADTAPVTAFWVVVGALGSAAVMLYFVTLHTRHGHVVESPLFLVHDVAATGAIAGLLISRYDVRSRRHTETVAQQERRFRAVFESTLDALVVVDDEGRYVAANDSAVDLFGVSRETLLDGAIAEFVEDDFDTETKWSRFLDEGAMRGEVCIDHPDGETRTAEFAATANFLPGRHLAALRDITPRVERERERDTERARLDFLNQLLRHHVLNGMNIILGKLDVVESAVPADHADDVSVARGRGESIVDLIRIVGRLSSDVPPETSHRAVDLVATLERGVETMRRTHPDVCFEVDSLPSPVLVTADETLSEVFDHLLANAAEHNDAETPWVRVTVDAGPETVTVAVADNGPGIPADRRDDLLGDDPFDRTRDWGGFGLYIVTILVEEFGGRIRAEENEPTGTRLVVEFPRTNGG